MLEDTPFHGSQESCEIEIPALMHTADLLSSKKLFNGNPITCT